jgi:hypothetical protein
MRPMRSVSTRTPLRRAKNQKRHGRSDAGLDKVNNLREAFLLAAEPVGDHGGLVAYLRRVALREPKLLVGLLQQILVEEAKEARGNRGKNEVPIQKKYN